MPPKPHVETGWWSATVPKESWFTAFITPSSSAAWTAGGASAVGKVDFSSMKFEKPPEGSAW